MYTRRLVPLYCSATLFLTGVAWGQSAAPDPALEVSAAASAEVSGPALAPPVRHQHTLTPQEQELLQRYDKNGDGKLDAAELDAAHGAAQQAKLSRDVLARQLYDRLLEQFDTAHEGKLNADQQKQAVDFVSANRPRVFQALLREFDRNGDGKLDANETTSLFQYFSSLPSDLSAAGATGAIGGAQPPGALAEPLASPNPTAVPFLAPPAPTLPSAPGGRAPPPAQPPIPSSTPSAVAPEGGASAAAVTGDRIQPAPVPDLAASLDAVPATPPPKEKGVKVAGSGGARFYSLLLQKFDHANQGSLTPAEQAEAIAYLASNNPRLYARLVARFDRNRDGRLDPDETARMFDRLAKASERAKSSE